VRFGEGLLLLDLINSVQASDAVIDNSRVKSAKILVSPSKAANKDKTVEEHLQASSQGLLDLYELLKSTLVGFGDDVVEKRLKLYVAFKRIKNFASVEIVSTQEKLRCWIKVNPDTVHIEDGFTRDVRAIGHWGTGDLEITLTNAADVQKALPLFLKSYEAC
jgi:predicted transport protein